MLRTCGESIHFDNRLSGFYEDAVKEALQDKYSPKSTCFGCGPANQKGLRIKSFSKSPSEAECEWRGEVQHEAFPGALNGGIVGAIMDCHCNWTAAHHLMEKRNLESPPCTVTAEYTIKLLGPTPSMKPVKIHSKVVQSSERSVTVEAELIADGQLTATCHGVFVAVKPGHPAYHRW